MKPVIKSTKWYGRFWPPERKKVRIMQAILDYHLPEIEEEMHKKLRHEFLYGTTKENAND